MYDVDSLSVDVDFGTLYGEDRAFLDDAEPVNRLFAQGSDVVVYRPERIDTG